jgi:pimeloyl-ACP methyl ester carboxylesterase
MSRRLLAPEAQRTGASAVGKHLQGLAHEMRSFLDEDVRLSYEVFGKGDRTVVYMHGILLDSYLNHRLAEDLGRSGFRVVLLDLPGHGRSDKPHSIAVHRMDSYAQRVVHLLDEIGVERAVVGGLSLGADVALQLAHMAPERLHGVVLEMPVLEQAVPAALLIFAPLLFAATYGAPQLRALIRLLRRIPRSRLGALGTALGSLELDPDDIAAVLKGVVVGPVAPSVSERTSITTPALVIGHSADRLHPLGDAARLASQLPDARFVQADSILELRLRPQRLTGVIADFLNDVFETGHASRPALLGGPASDVVGL